MLGLGLGMGVGNGSGLKFVGSGPIASAPEASAGNQNLFYASSDLGVCKCVSVFNNEGTDWIDCGRPSWLSQIAPTVEYSVRAVVLFNTFIAEQIISGLSDLNSNYQHLLYAAQIRKLVAFSGGVFVGGFDNALTAGVFASVSVISRPAVKSGLSINGVRIENVATSQVPGPSLSASNLFIGGRFDGVTGNMDGRVARVEYINGYGAVIDRLDLNKWDGTGTVLFDSGHACTVTDGKPLTAKSYSWIPLSVLNCP